MTAVAQETELYRAEFETFQQGRPKGEARWLREIRESAMVRFEELGFPNTRLEDWKYTSVAPIARGAFRRAGSVNASGMVLPPLAAHPAFGGRRLVFVDGRHAPELSSVKMQDGLELLRLAEVLASRPELVEPYLSRHLGEAAGAFSALNTAFLGDGSFVRVAPERVVSQPIHVVYLSSRSQGGAPVVSYPRTVVLAGRASQVSIVETYLGPEDEVYFTNAVTEIVLEDGAVVDHYKVQQEGRAAFHVGTMGVTQARSSQFSTHSIALGGALVRNDVSQLFDGEGGECVMNGLFMASGTQHTDSLTRIDHARPHCTSRELYKGVLDGRSRGVFVGRIRVRKDAQKTDAQQTNKNVLMSRDALVQSVPQLEILADDVKCKHGSTTGQLDPVALFYLRSRGIDEEAARDLLTYAFASDIVGRIKVEPVRTALASYLRRGLPGGLDGAEAFS